MRHFTSEIATVNMNFNMCTPMGMCMCSIVDLQKDDLI
jgi:hypothetical protein